MVDRLASGGMVGGLVRAVRSRRLAANTPVLLRAAMVEGRTDLGLMSSGQVAGLIEDLPSCAELIGAIMRDAERCLDRMATLRSASKDFLVRTVRGVSRSMDHRRSTIVTLAWPPPSHMVRRP